MMTPFAEIFFVACCLLSIWADIKQQEQYRESGSTDSTERLSRW